MGAFFADGSHEIIAACMEVHRWLGPGLLESIYEEALCVELRLREIEYRRQVPAPVFYRGHALQCTYRVDLIVKERIIVEVKAVEALLPVHEAQALTYMRLLSLPTALLVNFNVGALYRGLRRLTAKSK